MKKLFLLLLTVLSAAARTLTLEWDPNTPEGLAGYRVYERTGNPAVYTRLAEVNATTTTASLPGVTYAVHTYVVTAFDILGTESAYSEPATWTPKPNAPTRLRVTLASTTASISFPTQADAQYTLESKPDISAPEWTALASVSTPQDSEFFWSEPASTKKFYRVETY